MRLNSIIRSSLILLAIAASGSAAIAASPKPPRACLPAAGVIGGTGHGVDVSPRDGIVGTGRSQDASSGIVGTGHQDTGSGHGVGAGDIVANTGSDGGGGIGGTGAPAGRIAKTTGKVFVRDRTNLAMILGENDAVCVGDQLATGSDNAAVIKFADGGVMNLWPNTSVRVEAFAFDANDRQKAESVVSLQKGQIRVLSGQIAKLNPDNYVTKSRDIAIRVMGTDFQVIHLPGKVGRFNAGTYVNVIIGQVRLDSSRGVLMLIEGESGYAGQSGIPQRLQVWPDGCN